MGMKKSYRRSHRRHTSNRRRHHRNGRRLFKKNGIMEPVMFVLKTGSIALVSTMNASVGGVSKVTGADYLVLFAHEIADMTTAEQTAYLKARLAAFIGGG